MTDSEYLWIDSGRGGYQKKKHKTLSLVYGAKDTEHNEAVVLVDLLVFLT